MAPKRSSPRSTRSHRSTLSLQKTEIIINAYDLLPPGKLTTLLWTVGSSLLHSGVVINGKEYAYGGHDKRGVTGVYWTKPRTLPPGGTFRQEILHGFTLSPQTEIDAIIHEVSNEFQGTAYNLLTKNCNHFTSYLCQRLTGRSGPGWLNRAASIGVALPCIVPRDWIEPPEYDTQGGDLLDEESDSDERSRMLRLSGEAPRLIDLGTHEDESTRRSGDRPSSARANGSQRQ
ncbi:PPPDE putative peptidase domain-domain-containing protein [Coniella lustricola]|uniref:PPPDE putative peptidase domain-domain-containing protein n=1 Tax=Coniella lustricola TaxID=2025994 RepID=A0A2T2ZVM6_9PEZI|nr:PPPDE putative peptidase domain-domain-containing protein [Coniella lustricola]